MSSRHGRTVPQSALWPIPKRSGVDKLFIYTMGTATTICLSVWLFGADALYWVLAVIGIVVVKEIGENEFMSWCFFVILVGAAVWLTCWFFGLKL